MKKNELKIVCNPCTNQIAYSFKNEMGEWKELSGSSPLSRQHYTKTSMERADEILKKVDEVYNRKNKGLDIIFEGTNKSFDYLQGALKCYLTERKIECKLGVTKIAVAGKKAVGKTSLIEGMEKLQHLDYKRSIENDYAQYSDENNHVQWIEINGIDLGKSNVEKAFRTLERLAGEGLSAVIYCVSSTSGRIEEIERNLIMKLVNDFSELKVMVVLTMCYKDDIQETVDEIEKITDQIKIVQTLAKEYKTGIKDESGNPRVIKPFGLDQVSKYVFEGR